MDAMTKPRVRVGTDGTVQVHDERSRFIRAGGAWLYRDDRG